MPFFSCFLTLGVGPGDRSRGGKNKNKHGNKPLIAQNNSMNQEHYLKEVLSGAPTYDLNVKEKGKEERKFTGRCRLFVGNLPQNITEDALKKLFEKYGAVSEVFLGKNNAFAFIKMDTRQHAEAARDGLDFHTYENRTLRVRLAAHAAAIRVKNISPNVSNELLEYAFSYFGDVERAIVIVDDRGRSTGEGIVEFARKSAAQNALKRCSQECFMLTAIPTPVDIEPFEQKDEDEGLTEKHLTRNAEFHQEREVGPRFAERGTFEFEFGMRWKQLFDLEKQKRERLENEIREDRQALQDQMEFARREHQANILREQLRRMEEQAGRFNTVRSVRIEDEQRREEERQRQQLLMRQRTEDVIGFNKDFNSLQRQENELRNKVNALQDMQDRQESMRHGGPPMGNGGPIDQPPPPPPFVNQMPGPMNDHRRVPPPDHIPPYPNALGVSH